MKKFLYFVALGAAFSFTACDSPASNSAEDSTVEEVVVEEAPAAEEAATAEDVHTSLTAHVCNDYCSADGCNFVCGEEGHVCTEACHGHAH